MKINHHFFYIYFIDNFIFLNLFKSPKKINSSPFISFKSCLSALRKSFQLNLIFTQLSNNKSHF